MARKPVFVIQKHDASSLHYDFRLEVDGVMKSWAVPKGPSLDPADKRLAMEVDDHPMSWNEFEGRIPKGSYGAGTVIVWDRGTYANEREETMAEALDAGRATFRLEGEKLRGSWSLRRTGDRKWLLVKKKDEDADPAANPVADRPESVVSGRTNDQV